MTDPVHTIPEFARNGINLASPRLGSLAVLASDEFFAAKERMLQDSEPVFIADKYDDNACQPGLLAQTVPGSACCRGRNRPGSERTWTTVTDGA